MKYGTDQCESGGEVVKSRGEEAALSREEKCTVVGGEDSGKCGGV